MTIVVRTSDPKYICIDGGNKYICQKCNTHIAFCDCPEYNNHSCRVCLPSCKVYKRKQLKKECMRSLEQQLNLH